MLFVALVIVFKTADAQVAISLTVTDGCAEAQNCYYKVTMIFYKNQNCTGDAAYCYFMTNDCTGFYQTQVDFNDCDFEEGTSCKVYVQKMSGENTVCSNITSCLEYDWGMPVFVYIH